MDPYSDSQLETLQGGKLFLEFLDQADQGESGRNRSLGIILMRLRITEVGQESVPEIQGNVAAEALDRCSGAIMIVGQDFAPIFWIERRGNRGRVDDIAEEDRQSAPFRVTDRATSRIFFLNSE